MCPNTQFFLVHIFLYFDWIQENTDQNKLRIWTLFRGVYYKVVKVKLFLKHYLVAVRRIDKANYMTGSYSNTGLKMG